MDTTRTPSYRERKASLTPHERIEELESYVTYLSHSFRKTSISISDFLHEYTKKMTDIEARIHELEQKTVTVKFVDSNPFNK